MKKINKVILTVFLSVLSLFFIKYETYALPSINRIYGKDRVNTSIEISRKGWTNSQYVIIADGRQFPDALSAAPLAKKYNAPIILVNNKLTDEIKNELKRLKAEYIFMIGGEGAISKNVENDLKNMNLKLERISGKDRYGTSIEIAKKLGSFDTIFIALGQDFPDALSIAPVAAIQQSPIILVNNNEVPKVVNDYIRTRNIKKSYIIGGEGVISKNLENKFTNVERIWGSNRYETNYKVISKFFNYAEIKELYIASGQDFPDALSASAYTAYKGSPLVLAYDRINNNLMNFIKPKLKNNSIIYMFGGPTITKDSITSDLIGRNIVITLDPSYGGSEKGQVGINGNIEKDVNLKIAQKVGNILSNNGMTVKYTRNNDRQLTENQRADISNNNLSDLFVSIRCNSYSNTSVNGTETYYVDSQSQKLANCIQQNLISYTRMTNRGVKEDTKHGYLRKTNATSILTCLGFMTNKEDENKLVYNSDKFADGIANGILEYVNNEINQSIKIKTISNLSDTVNQGYSYSLPGTVTAIMDNGRIQKVPISWNNTSINTSKQGTYTYEGTVRGYSSKVKLILKVIPNVKPSNGITICIDPGHGGYDSGAVGPTGVREKDVALGVGLKLGNILKQNGINVIYTRTSDSVSWPSNESQDLRTRVDFSNKNNANYYISIHCNSFNREGAYGTETYYSVYNNGSGKSQKLAQTIQDSLIKEMGSNNRGVKTANFYVIKNTKCPAILAELGFISNSAEEKRLANPQEQAKYAKALSDGILSFLKNN